MLKDPEGTIPTCTCIQFWHVLSISESNVKPNPNRLLFARNLCLQFDEFPWKIVNHWRQSLSFKCFQLPGGLHKESSASNQAWKKNGAFNSVLCQMSFQCWLRLFKILISHEGFGRTHINWIPKISQEKENILARSTFKHAYLVKGFLFQGDLVYVLHQTSVPILVLGSNSIQPARIPGSVDVHISALSSSNGMSVSSLLLSSNEFQ